MIHFTDTTQSQRRAGVILDTQIQTATNTERYGIISVAA